MPEYEEPLPGVLVRRLKRFTDDRGWLVELFRDDELPTGFVPAMGYISVTHPGVARGPHEHEDQTDGFVFLSGTFRLFLWEARSGKDARELTFDVGEGDSIFVTVPPGVVHAYKNIGESDAFVLNFPDRLYAGKGKAEPVDEIRHEDDAETRFRMDG
jgi:dTDP-4-dehydrorhamnose 3,5-epimerase